MVSVLDLGAVGPGFKSQTVYTHRATHQAAKLVAAFLRVARVTSGLVESNGWPPTAGFMTHVTCRLTARNRDQLGTLRSAIENGLPFLLKVRMSSLFIKGYLT